MAARDQCGAAGDANPSRYTTVGAPAPMQADACSTPAADTICQGNERAACRNCCQVDRSMSK